MAAPKQGGFKMSLGALKAKPGLKASPTQKDTKKPRLLLGDDEPDDTNKQQEITGWDAAEGGALDASGKKEKEGRSLTVVKLSRDEKEMVTAAYDMIEDEATKAYFKNGLAKGGRP